MAFYQMSNFVFDVFEQQLKKVQIIVGRIHV